MSDCSIEFQVTPSKAWSSVAITVPTTTADHLSSYFTRIRFGEFGKIDIQDTYITKIIAEDFTYKIDGTTYDMKIDLLFETASKGFVTVKIKEKDQEEWQVLFDKISQSMELAGQKISNIATVGAERLNMQGLKTYAK